MEPLDSGFVRPRQARYQAALRPDMNCCIHSKSLFNFAATPIQGVVVGMKLNFSGSLES
jgi:hypothetical protein